MVDQLSIDVAGRAMSVETGKLAKQANGAAVTRLGDTIVLAAAVMAEERREGTDFFPLTVDYREKTSAAGLFPGGYIKREGRPTEKETLTCRLTDRPLRPLFPEGLFNEIQILVSVLSADDKFDPDILAINASSAALALSDIPFQSAVGAVRVGLVGDQFIINPTYEEIAQSKLDLVIAGTETAVLMVEGRAKFVSEAIMLEALGRGHDALRPIARSLGEMAAQCGKAKQSPPLLTIPDAVLARVRELTATEMLPRLTIVEKQRRSDAMRELRQRCLDAIVGPAGSPPAEPDLPVQVELAFREEQRRLLRLLVLNEGRRIDGRRPDAIRQITCEVGVLPRTHGSALFVRGETQALAIATLGGKSDEQRADTLTGEISKQFMLHYNFPPFSTGEVKPVRGPSRRDVGHGILAERAIQAVLPDENVFPYTVRVTSDILESNGSSSMASVCGGSLALMDAGVPVSAAVAGIAMGLVLEGDRRVILTDILGAEDALGDMDFKIAGSAEGITAFQMDIKAEGLSQDTMREALEQAREARLSVLDIMGKTIAKPRESLSVYAPRITVLQISPDKIGALIGPGGRTIRKIQEETKTQIDIEDDGKVSILSASQEMTQKAVDMVKGLTEVAEVGKVYRGKVTRIMDFGAFVEILPGQEGLVRISELADEYVERVEDVVKIGDEVMVRVIEIDDKGRVNLSRRAASDTAAGSERPAPRPHRPHAERPRHGPPPRSGERPRHRHDRDYDRRRGDRHPRGPR